MPEPLLLTADFSGTPLTGAAPLNVSFTDLSTGAVIDWDWDFGDAGSSSDESPSHTYTAPGSYTVTLTVSDGLTSDSETKAAYVTVSSPPPPALESSSGIPLFVSGFDSSSGSVPLFAAGSVGSSGDSTLYVEGFGYPESSGTAPLFAAGSLPESGSVSLYIYGGSSASGLVPLFTSGVVPQAASGALVLSLIGDEVPAQSGLVPLSLFGSASSGWFGGIDLSIYSDESGNVASGTLPLFVRSDDVGASTGQMNLWVGGVAHAANGSVELYICGPSGTSLGVPMWVSGEGVSPGWVPNSGALNLYLARNPSESLPLYLRGPGEPASGDVQLFVRGAVAPSGGIELSLPNAVGASSGSARLFTSGW